MLEYLFPLLTVFCSVVAGQFALGAWINSRFEAMRKESMSMRDSLLAQLQYHERHDDRRFAEITNSLWEIRLQTALKGSAFDQKDHISRTTRTEETSGE